MLDIFTSHDFVIKVKIITAAVIAVLVVVLIAVAISAGGSG